MTLLELLALSIFLYIVFRVFTTIMMMRRLERIDNDLVDFLGLFSQLKYMLKLATKRQEKILDRVERTYKRVVKL